MDNTILPLYVFSQVGGPDGGPDGGRKHHIAAYNFWPQVREEEKYSITFVTNFLINNFVN